MAMIERLTLELWRGESTPPEQVLADVADHQTVAYLRQLVMSRWLPRVRA